MDVHTTATPSTTHLAEPRSVCVLRARVERHVRLAHDTFLLRLECPELAARMVPGQFVMLRKVGGDDPLLARPFALFDVWRNARDEPLGIEIGYHVVGKFTSWLAGQGDRLDALEMWGPLGNGFTPCGTDHLIMVAGGIGQTPFLAVAREAKHRFRYGQPARKAPLVSRLTLCYGVRNVDYLAGVEEFKQSGVDVLISTDDGSHGHAGLVTDLLVQTLDREPAGSRPAILCCGPERMMAAVSKLALQRGLPCQVSLETPMACGLGICFSCVAKVRDSEGGWDYQRTCVTGPIFPAEAIVWE